MLDTASGYGTCEARLGQFFQANPGVFAKAFIATKFGASYEKEVRGENPFDPSVASLVADFERSVAQLGRVDLLYMHLVSSLPPHVSLGALRDAELMSLLKSYRDTRKGGLKFIGASISDAKVFAAALKEGLLDALDVVQVPAYFTREVKAELEAVSKAGKAVVLNSPIRLTAGKQDPKEAYVEALSQPYVSLVLTGTRTHLQETVDYFTS